MLLTLQILLLKLFCTLIQPSLQSLQHLKKRERILLALYDIKFQVKMLPKNECCRFLVSDFIDKFFSVFIAEKKVFLSGGCILYTIKFHQPVRASDGTCTFF